MFEKTLNGDIDWEALRRLVNFHLENGTDAIVAAGTTGEPTTMSFAEHFDVIRSVVEEVNGRIPVIAGTGANATSEAVEPAEGRSATKSPARRPKRKV